MQQTPLQCLMTWLDCCNNTLWGSAQSFDLGGHGRQFSRDSLPVFSTGDPCDQFWHGQGCPLFDVVYPAFPLPPTVLPTLQGSLEDGFGENSLFKTLWGLPTKQLNHLQKIQNAAARIATRTKSKNHDSLYSKLFCLFVFPLKCV